MGGELFEGLVWSPKNFIRTVRPHKLGMAVDAPFRDVYGTPALHAWSNGRFRLGKQQIGYSRRSEDSRGVAYFALAEPGTGFQKKWN